MWTRGRSKTAATSKMERFVIIVNGLNIACCINIDLNRYCKTVMLRTTAKLRIFSQSAVIKDFTSFQKWPFKSVLSERCPENMQQVYRRTPMPNGDFKKVVLQFYWNHTLTWWPSYKLVAYFQNTILQEHRWMTASEFLFFNCWSVYW